MLIAINGLSALDFWLTRVQIDAGIAAEANPVLAPLFAGGTFDAWAFKTLVTLTVTVAIWRSREKRQVLVVAVGALVAYVLVTVYHLVGMALFGSI